MLRLLCFCYIILYTIVSPFFFPHRICIFFFISASCVGVCQCALCCYAQLFFFFSLGGEKKSRERNCIPSTHIVMMIVVVMEIPSDVCMVRTCYPSDAKRKLLFCGALMGGEREKWMRSFTFGAGGGQILQKFKFNFSLDFLKQNYFIFL